MADLDPMALSRELSRAEEDVRFWHERLRQEPEFFDDPFQPYRRYLGRNQFEELWEMPETDPLRAPLLRWTYVLAEERINHWWLTQNHRQRYSDLHGLETPIRGKRTIAAMLREVLTPSSVRELYYAALERTAAKLSDSESMLLQRKLEIRERFGAERVASLLQTPAFLPALAQRTLQWDALEEFKRSTFCEWVEQGFAMKAGLALPSRLNEVSIADWFREGRLLDDLPLASWTLPQLLVPAAFLRALDELGWHFRRAAAPRHQPFVVAHDPRGLENHCFGFCLASLLTNREFVTRKLGLAAKQQIDFVRAMSRSLVLDFAQRAFVSELHAYAEQGSGNVRDAFQERAESLTGAVLSPKLHWVVFRQRQNPSERLLGAAMGIALALELREQHDEDWFRNPRAVEDLRSRAQLSPRVAIEATEATRCFETAWSHLASLLA